MPRLQDPAGGLQWMSGTFSAVPSPGTCLPPCRHRHPHHLFCLVHFQAERAAPSKRQCFLFFSFFFFFWSPRPACLLGLARLPVRRLIPECAILPGVHSDTPVVLCSVSCHLCFSFLLPLPSSSPSSSSPAATVEYDFFLHFLSVRRIPDDSFDPCVLAYAPLFFFRHFDLSLFICPYYRVPLRLLRHCSATLRLHSLTLTWAPSLSTPANSIHSFHLG